MEIRPVPQKRIIEKMDDYMSRRDYAGAERHLLYWLEEALAGQDLRGQLMLRNELIGHYRKTAAKRQALENVEEAVRLLEVLQFENSISAGTTYVNAATACNAFGDYERAAVFFEKARSVYESQAQTNPQLLGGLYNNMALNCVSLARKNRDLPGKKADTEARFKQAFALYDKAMEQMRLVPNGELEQAITCLNRADALEAEKGPEAAEKEIEDLLDTASVLLDTPSVPRDGYYAFVCEKCAPSFSYYGYFLEAEELSRRAEELYAAGK